MNQITTTKTPQLPVHLQFLQEKALAVNEAAMAGLTLGGWPRISIKGGRFRLQAPSQEEIVVPEHFLDVIVVDANPTMSKVYYDTKWDPNSDGEAPACYSDNGVGPSSSAQRPQHANCATCPHNQWGSKISDVSGKQIKACADVKKLAVLIAGNPSGPVFELRVPGDSLKNLARYMGSLNKHGIPLSALVTRLTFDVQVSHQRLIFAPAFTLDGQLPYINAAQGQAVQEVLDSDESNQCTGKNDTALTPEQVAQRKAAGNGHAAPGRSYQGATIAPERVGPTPPPSPAYPHQQAAAVTPPVAALAQEAAPRRRGRPAVKAKAPEPQPSVNAANATTPIAVPTVADAALDDLIAKAMGV